MLCMVGMGDGQVLAMAVNRLAGGRLSGGTLLLSAALSAEPEAVPAALALLGLPLGSGEGSPPADDAAAAAARGRPGAALIGADAVRVALQPLRRFAVGEVVAVRPEGRPRPGRPELVYARVLDVSPAGEVSTGLCSARQVGRCWGKVRWEVWASCGCWFAIARMVNSFLYRFPLSPYPVLPVIQSSQYRLSLCPHSYPS